MMFAIVLMIRSPLVFTKYVDWYYSCLHFSDGTKVTSYLAIDQIKSPIRGIGFIFWVGIYLQTSTTDPFQQQVAKVVCSLISANFSFQIIQNVVGTTLGDSGSFFGSLANFRRIWRGNSPS